MIADALLNKDINKDAILREYQLSKVVEQQLRLIEQVKEVRDRLDTLQSDYDTQCAEHAAAELRLHTDIVAQQHLAFDLPADTFPWST